MDYTKGVLEHIQDMFNQEMDKIWADITPTNDMKETDKWAKKIKSIAQKYKNTSRFALMRLCQKWATTAGDGKIDAEDAGFTVKLNGKSVQFSPVTIENAINLSEEEISNYVALLLDHANCEPKNPNYDSVKALIEKAMTQNTILSREEAFVLGHTLRFSLEEMQWFLLRTQEEDSGFQFNTSNDLIEAYGFLTQASSERVRKIKEEYQRQTNNIPKISVEEKEQGSTLDLEKFVLDFHIELSDDSDKQFMEQMVERASFLDLPSKSALTVYRKLAVLAYGLIYGYVSLNEWDDTSFLDAIKYILANTSSFVEDTKNMLGIRARETEYPDESEKLQNLLALYGDETKKIPYNVCNYIADMLVTANQNYDLDSQPDLRKRFANYIKMKRGQISNQGGIDTGNRSIEEIQQGSVYTDQIHIDTVVQSARRQLKVDISRKRIEDLLYGDFNVINERAIDKPDILYMLWLVAMLYWINDDRTENKRMDANTAECWLTSFVAAAQLCLMAANLPEFYPPHLLEQSMMLSLVRAGVAEAETEEEKKKKDPAYVYYKILQSLKKERQKSKEDSIDEDSIDKEVKSSEEVLL